jgi:hypothetical protein
MKNKKGQLEGFNTARNVIVVLVIIVALAIAGIMVGSTFVSTDLVETTETEYLNNASTLTVVNETGSYPTSSLTLANLDSCSLTATTVKTGTGATISSGNYSITGCQIACSGCAVAYNNSSWYVSGSFTYDLDRAEPISGNYSTGLADFFGNASTLFTVLFVVVLVGLLALVIYILNRFASGRSSF